MEFKDRLKEARTKKAYSQNELAKIVGAHVTNISRYERGGTIPTTEVLNKLANALDTTADYLMNGTTSELANEAISDKEMLSLFKKASLLPPNKKEMIKEFLDALIFKTEVKSKLG